MSNNATTETRPLPNLIARRLRAYLALWRVSAHLHYLLGGSSVLCAALAATDMYDTKLLAAASAVLTALIGFVQPQRHYHRFVRAWRVLDSASVRYQLGLSSNEALAKALERSEQLITESETSEVSTPTSQNAPGIAPPPP